MNRKSSPFKWRHYARTLVNACDKLHVVMGGAGQGGTGSNGGITMTIAGGHVQVLTETWKIR